MPQVQAQGDLRDRPRRFLPQLRRQFNLGPVVLGALFQIEKEAGASPTEPHIAVFI
jgi:hypothetical protein